MGRDRAIRYTLKITCTDNMMYTPSEWRVTAPSYPAGAKADGKPTPENIDAWVLAFEQSRINGANRHLGVASVKTAFIYDHKESKIVAEWNRRAMRPNEPLFQVIDDTTVLVTGNEPVLSN